MLWLLSTNLTGIADGLGRDCRVHDALIIVTALFAIVV